MDGSAAEDTGGAQALSLRSRLVLLVLAFLIPGLLITGFLMWDLERQSRKLQERQLAATARALALVVDRQIGEQAATVLALSTAPSLKAGDWKTFDAQAREAMRGQAGWVVVRQRNGSSFVTTRRPYGANVPPPPLNMTPVDWAGLRNGAYVSNLYTNAVLPDPVIIVRLPITLDDGRKVDLSVTTLATGFGQVFRDQGLPATWTGGILDASGRLVARSHGNDRYAGRIAPPGLLAKMQGKTSGIAPTTTYDGVVSYAAFDTLPYRWRVIVAVPVDEMVGAARRSLIAWVGVGVLLLAAAVLLAVRVAGGVARPVERLAQAAADWVAGRPVALPARSGLPETDSLGAAFAGALAAVEARDAQQTLLINELNHRVKNTLATVQSIALHSRRANTSAEDFHGAFEGRLMAMSAAHDLLTRTSWEGAALDDVAQNALRPFLGPRLRISGPVAQIGPTTALNLSLILYELATNAAKYGALSVAEGQVELSWKRAGGKLRVTWVETGGPLTGAPTRKGFGSRLIERAARDLQPASLDFEPEGVRCTLTIDIAVPDAVRGFRVPESFETT